MILLIFNIIIFIIIIKLSRLFKYWWKTCFLNLHLHCFVYAKFCWFMDFYIAPQQCSDVCHDTSATNITSSTLMCVLTHEESPASHHNLQWCVWCHMSHVHHTTTQWCVWWHMSSVNHTTTQWCVWLHMHHVHHTTTQWCVWWHMHHVHHTTTQWCVWWHVSQLHHTTTQWCVWWHMSHLHHTTT